MRPAISAIFLALFRLTATTKDVDFQSPYYKFLVDLSERCIRSATVFYTGLTFQAGVSDSRTLTFFYPTPTSVEACPIMVRIPKDIETGIYLSLVLFLEITVQTDLYKLCRKDRDFKFVLSVANGSLLAKTDNTVDLCRDIREFLKGISNWDKRHRVLTHHNKVISSIGDFKNSDNRMLFSFRMRDFEGTVRLTMTTARSVKDHDDCNKSIETFCKVRRNLYCINNYLNCDKIPNCGFYNRYDEDNRICRREKTEFYVAIGIQVLVIMVLLFFILITLLNVCIPSVTKNFFIFDDDDNRLVLTSQLKPPLDSDLVTPPTTPSSKNSERDLDLIYKINMRQDTPQKTPSSTSEADRTDKPDRVKSVQIVVEDEKNAPNKSWYFC